MLAVNVPVMHYGKTPSQIVDYYREAMRRIRELPGVENVAIGTAVPWRDATRTSDSQFAADGHVPAPARNIPGALIRIISPGFFATLGLPIIEGRDFNDADRDGSEPVAIVSQSVAQRMFPEGRRAESSLYLDRPDAEIHSDDQQPRRSASSAWWPTWTT